VSADLLLRALCGWDLRGAVARQFPQLFGAQASSCPMRYMKYADGTCRVPCLLNRIVHLVSAVAFSVQRLPVSKEDPSNPCIMRVCYIVRI
jgi:hypothetical protein